MFRNFIFAKFACVFSCVFSSLILQASSDDIIQKFGFVQKYGFTITRSKDHKELFIRSSQSEKRIQILGSGTVRIFESKEDDDPSSEKLEFPLVIRIRENKFPQIFSGAHLTSNAFITYSKQIKIPFAIYELHKIFGSGRYGGDTYSKIYWIDSKLNLTTKPPKNP